MVYYKLPLVIPTLSIKLLMLIEESKSLVIARVGKITS